MENKPAKRINNPWNLIQVELEVIGLSPEEIGLTYDAEIGDSEAELLSDVLNTSKEFWLRLWAAWMNQQKMNSDEIRSL